MSSYISIILSVVLLPFFYSVLLLWYRADFEKTDNQQRKPLSGVIEKAVMLLSETALVRIWYALGQKGFEDLTFALLYVMLVGMTVFCMTDLWEHVVPNKLLLLLIMVFCIAAGIQVLRDADGLLLLLPSIVLGVLFCALCFGMGYVLSRKSMGAGDVKLSLVMGMFLTGEYVVGTVLYGCLIGAAYSVIQLVRKKLSRKDTIPFVPFLYMGLIIRYWMG